MINSGDILKIGSPKDNLLWVEEFTPILNYLTGKINPYKLSEISHIVWLGPPEMNGENNQVFLLSLLFLVSGKTIKCWMNKSYFIT